MSGISSRQTLYKDAKMAVPIFFFYFILVSNVITEVASAKVLVPVASEFAVSVSYDFFLFLSEHNCYIFSSYTGFPHYMCDIIASHLSKGPDHWVDNLGSSNIRWKWCQSHAKVNSYCLLFVI